MAFANSIKRLLPKNKFARSVSVMSGGTAMGQGVALLAAPILTRLYSPEDFGLLGVFSSFLMIFGGLASLRYQLAIPLPERDEDAAHVVALSLLVAMATTLFVSLAVFFLSSPIAKVFNTPTLADYFWLLPIGILLLSIYQALNYWAIRTKAFSVVARTKLTQSASMVAVQLLGYTLGPVSLLLGQIIGQAAGSGSLSALALRKHKASFRQIRLAGIARMATRYRRFPIYSTWAGGFNIVGAQLPPLIFAAFFQSATAGLYILANRVLSVPMTLLGRAVGDVFFAGAAEANRNGTLPELVTETHRRLAQIAMPLSLFLFITGPHLFAFIFGEEWRQAGQVARWLAPMLYIQFIVSPLSIIFYVLERQPLSLMLQGVLFFARLSALVVGGIVIKDFMVAVFLYGIASFIAYAVYLISISLVCQTKMTDVFNINVKTLFVSFILTSPVLASAIFHDSALLIFFASTLSIMGIIMFYYFLYKSTLVK